MSKEKTIKPFSKISYLSQVRRLRTFAQEALKKYSIGVHKLEFINHGENATFKVTSTDGSKYLLRIHRNNYHTKEAIEEELCWLNKVSQSEISAPKPILSMANKFVETIEVTELNLNRNCCLFRWVEGNFINKSLRPRHMFEIGKLLGQLQELAPKNTNRKYWDAEGLLGHNAKFGSIDSINGASKEEQYQITLARKATLKILKKYEAKYPMRSGMIHADLHFGNLLVVGSEIGAIDFDDCGFGFFVYDLVAPYISMQNILGKRSKKKFSSYKEALVDGYKSIRPWDQSDDEIFSHLVTTRKLSMLGWLNSRSDNPKLKKYLKRAIKNTLEHINFENKSLIQKRWEK